MFFGLATYIGLHYWPAVDQPNNQAGLTRIIAMLAAAIVVSQKWWIDIWFLLRANQVEYEAYREELLGDRKPEKELDWLMRLHGFFRRFQNKKEERKSHA
jgi:hypothetical protein